MAVAVPGAFRGYEAIYKAHGGGVSWESLFEPTIKLCEEGIKISEHLELTLETDEAVIKRDPMLRYNHKPYLLLSANLFSMVKVILNTF